MAKVDMTHGSITRHLLEYTVPMVLGNIMQLTYNAADSVIIGKNLGDEALAAVSVSDPIMTVMVLGASGVGIGASVLMSRFYGAGDREKLRREFSTTVIFGLFFSLAVFLLGFAFAGELLRLIKAPAEAYDMALTYLRIIFVGFLFTFQYNILSSALRAIGDSRTSVWFLGISCGINICLDMLFIMVFHLGVAGAGLATVIAEATSVILCVVWIRKRIPELSMGRREFKVDKPLLLETVKNGALTALQQAAQPVGKLLIQRTVNLQGVVAVDAFNNACRIDDYARIPTQSMGSAIMTCTAQNRGAGDRERVRESFKKGLLIACVYYPIIFVLVQLLKVPAMRLLSPKGSDAIVEAGVAYLAVKSWFFIMPGLTNAIQGFFRGVGSMTVVLISTVIQIGVRTVFVWLLVPQMGIVGEAYACAAGWTCMIVFEFTLYFVRRKKGKV